MTKKKTNRKGNPQSKPKQVSIDPERLDQLLFAEYMLARFFEHGVEEWEGFEKAFNVDDDDELTEEDLAAFDCLDCDVNTLENDEYYMIQFDMWKRIHPDNDGMLCIGCLEKRLGRELIAADFIDAPVNNLDSGIKSERLINRLTKV